MWPNFSRIKASLAPHDYQQVRGSEDPNQDETNEPLLPTTLPVPIPKAIKRSFRRSKLRNIVSLVAALLFLLILPPLLSFLHLYVDPGYEEKFALTPMVPQPTSVQHLVSPISSVTEPSLDSIQDELASRLLASGMPANDTPACSSLADPAVLARYTHLKSRRPTFIALNLYESDPVLPSISRTLLDLAYFLGTSNVHVSIFENGSRDNTTIGLAHLAAALNHAGIPHTITSDTTRTKWAGVDRIEQLSIFRNVVLEPLYSNTTSTPFETVVFINDVFLCATDALELLHQRVVQDAHATCGLDYRWRHPALSFLWEPGPKFYDNWVTRSLSGNTLRSRLDVFSEVRDGLLELFPDDLESRDRFRMGRPLPVYSCWNGMIALDARPLLGIGLDGQPREKIVFRGAKRRQRECAASECKLIARDYWDAGFNRWVLVPFVHVTYPLDLYGHKDLATLSRRAQSRWRLPPPSLVILGDVTTPGNSTVPDGKLEWAYPHKQGTTGWEGEEKDLINWKNVEGPESVVCWPYHGAQGVDWWWTRVVEKVKTIGQ